MTNFSQQYAQQLIEYDIGRASLPAAAPIFLALCTSPVNGTYTGTTLEAIEAVYVGYKRSEIKATQWKVVVTGAISEVVNEATVVGAGCTSGSSTIVSIATCTSVTKGVMRRFGELSEPKVITAANTPPEFLPGELRLFVPSA